MKDYLKLALAGMASSFLLACQPAGDSGNEAGSGASDAQRETAAEFVARVNNEITDFRKTADAAEWIRSNFITVDSGILAAKYAEDYSKLLSESVEASTQYDLAEIDGTSARALKLLRLGTSQPAPNNASDRAELATITTSLEGQYGAGKYCPEDEDRCYELGELENVLAESRDYDEMLDAWAGWRTISPPMRKEYQRFVELTNAGAQELGFNNLADMWKSGYDMSPADFDAEATRLWGQVKPLYDELHCYVRRELNKEYGDKVALDKPIPAHLLGNMWAQQWGEIFDLVQPYPGVADLDVDAALVSQEWSAEKMVRTAEDFFVSLGLPSLPDTFYERSLLTKPADRDVVCHASAWDLGGGKDPRIKMCIEPTYEMLSTIYHELGHIYYFIAYVNQPVLFRDGAHDGFHEGIGDTIVLSLTPQFLKKLGLVSEVASGDQALINTQMKMALDKVAFLPFGKMIDEWRWRVFAGDIAPGDYNAGWWELREKYQGIAPPIPRTEADFDPGAKYHIPANTPYTRYFLSHILQFQFQRALCDAAGFDGPLHECSIYGSKEAGKKLEAMLAAGSSEPWQDTLEKLTGTREMDASAIIDYFEPLDGWLKQQNDGQSCGW